MLTAFITFGGRRAAEYSPPLWVQYPGAIVVLASGGC